VSGKCNLHNQYNHTNYQSRLPWTFLFAGQYQHLLLLACLIPGAIFIANPSLYEQTGLRKPAYFWFYAGIITAIVHQFVVCDKILGFQARDRR
jgi:hypothetical protein